MIRNLLIIFLFIMLVLSCEDVAPTQDNPFNPQRRIDFGLPETGHVNLKIYDIMGREVVTLLNETISAGYKSILWNATNKSGQPVSAGMYFYALQVKDFMQIKKMVLLK